MTCVNKTSRRTWIWLTSNLTQNTALKPGDGMIRCLNHRVDQTKNVRILVFDERLVQEKVWTIIQVALFGHVFSASWVACHLAWTKMQISWPQHMTFGRSGHRSISEDNVAPQVIGSPPKPKCLHQLAWGGSRTVSILAKSKKWLRWWQRPSPLN